MTTDSNLPRLPPGLALSGEARAVASWPQQVMKRDDSKEIVYVHMFLWNDGSVTWDNVVK